jgi:hypothetical protein
MEPMADGLRAALDELGATVRDVRREAPRSFVRATAADGRELFGRWSSDPEDHRHLDRDAAVRERVGTALPLRAPAPLARGRGWVLEPAAEPFVPRGREVEDVVAAALAIPALALPPATGEVAGGAGGGPGLGARLRRLLRRPDVLLAQLAARACRLPDVACHGDLHAGNLLRDADGPWVVDWELAGPGPLGLDLLTLWPTLPEAPDRDRVLVAALEQAGPGRRRDVHLLRYALAVRALVGIEDPTEGVGGSDLPVAEFRARVREARRAVLRGGR